jgi:ankyrin repeat protein
LIGVVDKYNNSPLLYAVDKENIDIIILLCKKSRLHNINTSIPGIINKEREYSDEIFNMKYYHNYILTPLMLAVKKKNIDVIKILMKYTNIYYQLPIKNSNDELINGGVTALFYAFNYFYMETYDNINDIEIKINIIKLLCKNNILNIPFTLNDRSD